MKNNFDWQDFLLRSLFMVAGGLAAALMAMKGHGEALPALAVGGLAGAYLVRAAQTEEE